MSKLEKLDLMGVLSLAAVVVALALGWIATTRIAMAAELVPSRFVAVDHVSMILL